MSMNLELVKIIRETQYASEKCTRELIKVREQYGLTDAGVEGAKQSLYDAVIVTQKESESRAAGLIDSKITELDAAEVQEVERRGKDIDYMNRLQTKINMIGSVDLQKITDETLKAIFAEFENDPFAIEMLRAAIPTGRTVRIEPVNSNGKKQDHLQDVKKAVLRAISKAGAYISIPDLESGNIPWKEETDALVAYIMEQSEDFSKNDAEVWDAVVKKNPEIDVWAKAWQMRFSNVA